MIKKFCVNKKHYEKEQGYMYNCKKCHRKDGKISRSCSCGHKIFMCTICWKPVALINGMYWFVPIERCLGDETSIMNKIKKLNDKDCKSD